MPQAMLGVEPLDLTIEVGKERPLLGAAALVTKIEGWNGGPGVRRPSIPRMNNHGSYSSRGWRDERVVSIEGEAWADDRRSAGELVDSFAAALAEGTLGRLLVLDPDQGARFSKCYIQGGTEITWDAEESFGFAFDVVCPDPRKYGVATSGGTTGVQRSGGGLRFPLFAGAPLAEARRNYATNPAYATTLAPSAASTNATAVWEGTGGHPEAGESGRARVTSTAAGQVRLAIQSIPVAPGEVVTLSFWIRASANDRNLRAQIDWNGASGYINAIITGSISAPGGVWQRISITGTAPAGATSAFAFARMENAAAAGEIFAVDGVLIEKAPTAGAYFDGSTTNTNTFATSWAGTPNASESVYSTYSGKRGILDFGSSGSPGTVTVTNSGTAPTSVRFYVDGGGSPGFTITEVETRRRLVYAAEVPANQELSLDSATGAVLLNGYAERSGGLARAEWPTIPGRTTRTYLYESLGEYSTMRAEANPAWW